MLETSMRILGFEPALSYLHRWVSTFSYSSKAFFITLHNYYIIKFYENQIVSPTQRYFDALCAITYTSSQSTRRSHLHHFRCGVIPRGSQALTSTFTEPPFYGQLGDCTLRELSKTFNPVYRLRSLACVPSPRRTEYRTRTYNLFLVREALSHWVNSA